MVIYYIMLIHQYKVSLLMIDFVAALVLSKSRAVRTHRHIQHASHVYTRACIAVFSRVASVSR